MVNQSLSDLNRSLMALHKGLLSFQSDSFQALEERQISAYDLLHLSISHPDFFWLREVSALIAQIDERLDSKELPLAGFQQQAFTMVGELIFPKDDLECKSSSSFQAHLQAALTQNPDLEFELARLRGRWAAMAARVAEKQT